MIKKSVSVSCQTDIDQLEMEELVKNVVRLKIENKVLRNKVNNKPVIIAIFTDQIMINIRKPEVWNIGEDMGPKLKRKWMGK